MAAFLVLGPVVAKRSLGGAVSWGFIQTGLAAGLLLGGVIALRLRAPRPLLSAPLAGLAIVPVLGLLALDRMAVVVVAAAVVAGAALSVFAALYMTELQNQIPSDRLSRVMSYELLASMLFIPAGAPAIGLLATAVGVSHALWCAAAAVCAASLAPLALRHVRGPRLGGASGAALQPGAH
jgi:predicted MFS family arabinose efflux permease